MHGCRKRTEGGYSKRAAVSCYNQVLPQPSLCGYSRYCPWVGGLDCKVDRRLLEEGMAVRGYRVTKPAVKALKHTYQATSVPVTSNPANTSSLPTMLINWLFCQSKHSSFWHLYFSSSNTFLLCFFSLFSSIPFSLFLCFQPFSSLYPFQFLIVFTVYIVTMCACLMLYIILCPVTSLCYSILLACNTNITYFRPYNSGYELRVQRPAPRGAL
jgi:hypothetical protein